MASEAYFDNMVFKTIYSFHMPLFMIISGYLFAFSAAKGTWKTTVSKKVKSVLIPLLLWSLISFIIKLASGQLPMTMFGLAKGYLRTSVVSLWFLWAVLLCSVFVSFVRYFLKDNIVIYAAVFAVSFVIPDFFSTELFKFMYPYFVLGYFAGKSGGYKVSNRFINTAWIVSGVLFVGLLCFYNYDSYIYTSKFCIMQGSVFERLGTDIYRFAIGFAGCVFVIISVSKLTVLLKGKAAKLVSQIGMNTMGIYILSVYINEYILPTTTYKQQGASCLPLIIETVCVTAVCMAVIKLIKKSKTLNKYLLGGR